MRNNILLFLILFLNLVNCNLNTDSNQDKNLSLDSSVEIDESHEEGRDTQFSTPNSNRVNLNNKENNKSTNSTLVNCNLNTDSNQDKNLSLDSSVEIDESHEEGRDTQFSTPNSNRVNLNNKENNKSTNSTSNNTSQKNEIDINIFENNENKKTFKEKYGNIEDPSKLDDGSRTILHKAIRDFDGNLETMKKLITNPKSKLLTRSKFNRWTPFQEITLSNAPEEKITELSFLFFEELKKRKDSEAVIKFIDEKIKHRPHASKEKNDLNLFLFFVKSGKPISAFKAVVKQIQKIEGGNGLIKRLMEKDDDGNNIFHLAASGFYWNRIDNDFFSYLFSLFENLNIKYKMIKLLNEENKKKQTPLEIISRHAEPPPNNPKKRISNISTIKKMINDYGADYKHKNKTFKTNCITQALSSGNLELIKYYNTLFGDTMMKNMLNDKFYEEKGRGTMTINGHTKEYPHGLRAKTYLNQALNGSHKGNHEKDFIKFVFDRYNDKSYKTFADLLNSIIRHGLYKNETIEYFIDQLVKYNGKDSLKNYLKGKDYFDEEDSKDEKFNFNELTVKSKQILGIIQFALLDPWKETLNNLLIFINKCKQYGLEDEVKKLLNKNIETSILNPHDSAIKGIVGEDNLKNWKNADESDFSINYKLYDKMQRYIGKTLIEFIMDLKPENIWSLDGFFSPNKNKITRKEILKNFKKEILKYKI